MRSFHIRNMDKAIELLKKWGYELCTIRIKLREL